MKYINRKNKWQIRRKRMHRHPCCEGKGRVYNYENDGIFGNVQRIEQTEGATEPKQIYECPRGHRFKTNNPIVIAVDGDSEYNSGPICGYCYVDWFKLNLNASEESMR